MNMLSLTTTFVRVCFNGGTKQLAHIWFILAFSLCLLPGFSGCKNFREKASNQFTDKFLRQLAECKSFDQAFEKVRDVQLSTQRDALIGRVTDLVIASDGRIIVADDMGRQVLMFSPEGKFLRRIGRFGDGPGEYHSPSLVTVDPEQNIYVFDPTLAKVFIFDAEGNFKRLIFTREFVSRMAATSSGVYLQEFTFQGRNSIFQYDTTGKLIRTFSSIPENFRELLMRLSAGGGLVADDQGNLYQITVAKYEILKFSPDGSLMAKFARTPPFLKPYPEKLPSHANDRRKFNELIFDRTLIHRLFYLKPGLLLVQLINHDAQRRPTVFFEIYDVYGRFVTGFPQVYNVFGRLLSGKPLFGGDLVPNLVISSFDSSICFEIHIHNDSTGVALNPKLAFYRLRGVSQ